ncbi:MAG: DNA-processing protein DprA, partial [Solirubrobacterales bacterium]|nr:DNA-processing protein DprA [Solirubrobacterales bacterium]
MCSCSVPEGRTGGSSPPQSPAHDRPALLFIRGALEPADASSVAVVGARKASPAGQRRASQLPRSRCCGRHLPLHMNPCSAGAQSRATACTGR